MSEKTFLPTLCAKWYLLFILMFFLPRVYGAPEDYFISAETVASNLNNYRLLDARTTSEYLKGHIPGARSVQWQSFANMSGAAGSATWSTILDNKALQSRIQKLGLTPEDNIVVYADAPDGWGEDGRIAWSLRVAGLTNVRIMDGGYTYWKEKGFKTTLIPTLFNTHSDYEITRRDASSTIDTKALYKDYARFRVIDSRSPEEYHGQMDLGEQRKGHLPEAVNVPFQQLFTPAGTLKSFDDISGMLSDLDIEKTSPIVVYCTAGIRSAYLVMVLKADLG